MLGAATDSAASRCCLILGTLDAFSISECVNELQQQRPGTSEMKVPWQWHGTGMSQAPAALPPLREHCPEATRWRKLKLLHAGSAIAARGASRTKACYSWCICRVSAFQQCLESCATVAHVHTPWRASVHQTTCCPKPKAVACTLSSDARCLVC